VLRQKAKFASASSGEMNLSQGNPKPTPSETFVLVVISVFDIRISNFSLPRISLRRIVFGFAISASLSILPM
jgi:hypothetical protein